MKRISLLVSVTIIFAGCKQSTVSTAHEYSEWFNKEENGCKVVRTVNNMNITVKLLPASFLALKEFESSQGKTTFEHLYDQYKDSKTFLISFNPDDQEKGADVMYKDVANYKEYVERSLTLNFDLESKIKLEAGKKEYTPVLSSLENTYGLSKGRDVYMVFAPTENRDELDKAPYFDFIYSDDLYQLGTLHFVFDNNKINSSLPGVQLNKK